MKAGDRIRVQKYIAGHASHCDDYTVEEFRFCLGVFLSEADRTAQNFTPLCELFEPAPDAAQGYIPNYGPFWDKWVQGFMNLPRKDQP
jgi:hypothetical protein